MGKEIKGKSPIVLSVTEKNGNGLRFVVVNTDNKRKGDQPREQARGQQADRPRTQRKNTWVSKKNK